MKLVFSTKNVARASFLDLCRFADEYGFAGFEIYDAMRERTQHADSILRRDRAADAGRKLLNRGLSLSALRYPHSLETAEADADTLRKYVDMAAAAGVEYVIVRVEEKIPFEILRDKLADAVSRAESTGVEILFESVGYLSETENILDLINRFSSAAIGAAWNVRRTYFGAGESTETTIKTLSAYIK
jgi:sugar phosphate isomerase/epimerase